ncbi:MAG TPA: tripartite tricarboxylate transporter TctB family protein, partial [Geminicoccaceae bacterium]
RIVLPVVLLAVTTAYLLGALQIASPYEDEGVGPSFFPIVLAVVMYAALVAVLVQGLRANGATRAARLRLRDPAKVVGLTAVYVALFVPLGYFIATTLYVLSLFFVFNFGSRNHLWRLVAAVLIALASWLLFGAAFGVRLPKFMDLI